MSARTLGALVAVMALIALLQTSAFPSLRVIGVVPDVALLTVVAWGLVWGIRQALVCSIVVGTFLDLVATGSVGVSAIALAPVALLTGLERIEVVESRLTFAMLLALLGTVVYYVAFILLMVAGGAAISWIETLVWVVLPAAIINTVTMPLVLGSFYVLIRWTRVEPA